MRDSRACWHLCVYPVSVPVPCAAAIILPNLTVATSQQRAARNAHSAVSLPAPETAGAVVHPQQLFRELRQFGRLLGRPRIMAGLQQEQQALAKQVPPLLWHTNAHTHTHTHTHRQAPLVLLSC
jgi:hypothetical protein